VVFILGADTGVTKSDLAIWREHLITEDEGADTRLVVLNKIDTMWDSLSTPAQVRRRSSASAPGAAEMLGAAGPGAAGVGAEGPAGQGQQRPELLQASRLPALESLLGEGVLGQRRDHPAPGGRCRHDRAAHRGRARLNMRQRDLAEQMLELQGPARQERLGDPHMRARIEQEQAEFEGSGAQDPGVRSVQGKLLREVFAVLGTHRRSRPTWCELAALKQPGIKLGVRKVYAETFDRAARQPARSAGRPAAEIQSMLTATFRQLNAEHTASRCRRRPSPTSPLRAGPRARSSAATSSTWAWATLLKLAQPEFADKLVRALASRLRVVYEAAHGRGRALEQVRERAARCAAARAPPQLQPSASKPSSASSRPRGNLDERMLEIAAQERDLAELHKLRLR
jgi:hypothetical protein